MESADSKGGVVCRGGGAVRRAGGGREAVGQAERGAGGIGGRQVGLADAAEGGFAYGLVLPADLPLATHAELSAFLKNAGGAHLALAPDLANDGTNALLIDLAVSFPTKLGEHSFDRHVEQAQQLDIDCTVYRSEGLGLDIDTASDLERLIELEPGLWERLYLELQEAGLDAFLPVGEGAE